LTYPGTVSLSTAHLTYLSDVLRMHRAVIGSRWRKLPPHRQALLVPAHLRNGDTYSRLAAGFGVGVAAVFRYVREAVDLLAARAPSLTAALWRAWRTTVTSSASWTAPWCASTGSAVTWIGGTTPVSTTSTGSTCKGWSTRVVATWSGSPTDYPDPPTT